jgi:hypothetical protein
LNNILWINQWVIEEIRGKIKFLETNENENLPEPLEYSKG